MALPELVRHRVDKKIKEFFERKVPPHVRHQVRLIHAVRGNSVTLIEERPYFRDPSEWTQHRFAQIRYQPESKSWALYSSDRNGKWRPYPVLEPQRDLDAVIAEIDADPICTFFG